MRAQVPCESGSISLATRSVVLESCAWLIKDLYHEYAYKLTMVLSRCKKYLYLANTPQAAQAYGSDICHWLAHPKARPECSFISIQYQFWSSINTLQAFFYYYRVTDSFQDAPELLYDKEIVLIKIQFFRNGVEGNRKNDVHRENRKTDLCP